MFFTFKESAKFAIILAFVFRGTAVRRNISPSHVAVAICGRGGLIILMIMRRTMMAIAIAKKLFETVIIIIPTGWFTLASTKVSGLKASIDAALGRIFEIDGQNAEEEAR